MTDPFNPVNLAVPMGTIATLTVTVGAAGTPTSARPAHRLAPLRDRLNREKQLAVDDAWYSDHTISGPPARVNPPNTDAMTTSNPTSAIKGRNSCDVGQFA